MGWLHHFQLTLYGLRGATLWVIIHTRDSTVLAIKPCVIIRVHGWSLGFCIFYFTFLRTTFFKLAVSSVHDYEILYYMMLYTYNILIYFLPCHFLYLLVYKNHVFSLTHVASLPAKGLIIRNACRGAFLHVKQEFIVRYLKCEQY